MAVYLNVYRTSSEDEQVTAKVSAYQGSDWVMEVDSESDLSDALYEAVEKMEVVLIESENGREFTSCDYDVALLWDEAGGNYEDDEDEDEEDTDDEDEADEDDEYWEWDEEETEEDVAFGHMFDGYSEYQRGLSVDRNASTIEVDSDRKLEAGCSWWRITSPKMLQAALDFFQAKGFRLISEPAPLPPPIEGQTCKYCGAVIDPERNWCWHSGPTLGEVPAGL